MRGRTVSFGSTDRFINLCTATTTIFCVLAHTYYFVETRATVQMREGIGGLHLAQGLVMVLAINLVLKCFAFPAPAT